MRSKVTTAKLQTFMKELASKARGPGAVFFTGGATALIFGLREQTIDLDIKFEPEPRGVFEALAELKNSLDLNIELASPVDFIPVAPNWRELSTFIAQEGQIAFYHFDLRAQILSKIERSHTHDLEDARGFLAKGKISDDDLWSYYLGIKDQVMRYPAIDPTVFERKVKSFLKRE